MVKTFKINIELLKEMISEGYVITQKHPTLDINVYNYTRKCMFDGVWNEVTLICRGLILDSNYNLVSLPISKFFNIEELQSDTIEEKINGKKFKVYDKLDGCLDENTLILTEDGYKTIKWICDNKYSGNVITFNTILDKFELKPIIGHSVKRNIQNWYKITLENGVELLITGNQKIWVDDINAYRRVDELCGDEELLYNSDNFKMKIKKIEKIEHDSLRYDIEVKDNHNFFANDVLVHNSCGIAYNYNGEFGISTRGSFTSEQAIWATNILNSKYKEKIEVLNFDDYSFIFEIIYKENRIVCDYGNFEDIVLIAVIDKNTGEDLWLTEREIEIYKSSGFNFTEYYPEYSKYSFDELKEFNFENKEGFVIHFENGYRVKLKFKDYVRLHSIITNLTARDIWKTLKEGKDISEIINNVPDEFDNWVREKINFFNIEHKRILDDTILRHKKVKNSLSKNYTKKEFALKNIELNNKEYKGLVFSIENGLDISEQIWKLLYPDHEKAFFK